MACRNLTKAESDRLKPAIHSNTVEQLEAGGSHHEVGLTQGSHFANAIQRFFDSCERLQQQLPPLYYTPSGPIISKTVSIDIDNRACFRYQIIVVSD